LCGSREAFAPHRAAAARLVRSPCNQIAVLERGQQLAFAHMVSPVYVKLPHRRADLRHHIGLILWKKHPVGGGEAANRVQLHSRHLYGRDRLGFCCFFFGAAGKRDER
jgi:hypothetical protein